MDFKLKFRTKIIYILILIVCVISVFIAVYVQFFREDNLGAIVGIGSNNDVTEEAYEILRNNFDKLFTNSFSSSSIDGKNIKKINEQYDYVVSVYSKEEKVENKYEINVKIPNINIDNEYIKTKNNEIQELFYNKAKNIMDSVSIYTIYTVEYGVYVNDNILSMVIRSTLKEGNNPQRVIIQTYNYDLENNKQITLAEIIERKNLKEKEVQNKIKTDITEQQKQAEELRKIGYTVYERNVESDIYKIENTEEYFMDGSGYLYILYPYGNGDYTSETDMIIF